MAGRVGRRVGGADAKNEEAERRGGGAGGLRYTTREIVTVASVVAWRIVKFVVVPFAAGAACRQMAHRRGQSVRKDEACLWEDARVPW